MNKNIQLLVYDFDGVMTDNCVYVNEDGVESVKVNRSDGLAVEKLTHLGYKQLILSTETNPVVTQRAKKLKISVLQGQKQKDIALQNYCNENNIQLKNTLFIGNDINDMETMKLV